MAPPTQSRPRPRRPSRLAASPGPSPPLHPPRWRPTTPGQRATSPFRERPRPPRVPPPRRARASPPPSSAFSLALRGPQSAQRPPPHRSAPAQAAAPGPSPRAPSFHRAPRHRVHPRRQSPEAFRPPARVPPVPRGCLLHARPLLPPQAPRHPHPSPGPRVWALLHRRHGCLRPSHRLGRRRRLRAVAFSARRRRLSRRRLRARRRRPLGRPSRRGVRARCWWDSPLQKKPFQANAQSCCPRCRHPPKRRVQPSRARVLRDFRPRRGSIRTRSTSARQHSWPSLRRVPPHPSPALREAPPHTAPPVSRRGCLPQPPASPPRHRPPRHTNRPRLQRPLAHSPRRLRCRSPKSRPTPSPARPLSRKASWRPQHRLYLPPLLRLRPHAPRLPRKAYRLRFKARPPP